MDKVISINERRLGKGAPGASRRGEQSWLRGRRDRFMQSEDGWFFATREGGDMGPFGDRDEAMLSLLYYLERSEWADPRHLQLYRTQRCFD